MHIQQTFRPDYLSCTFVFLCKFLIHFVFFFSPVSLLVLELMYIRVLDINPSYTLQTLRMTVCLYNTEFFRTFKTTSVFGAQYALFFRSSSLFLFSLFEKGADIFLKY